MSVFIVWYMGDFGQLQVGCFCAGRGGRAGRAQSSNTGVENEGRSGNRTV